MPLSIAVVIRENPRQSHRAVEALRIALGLSTGPNPLTIILMDEAPLLLTGNTDDLIDAELLEKHLPVLKELGVCFVVPESTRLHHELDSGFHVRECSLNAISTLIGETDRVLVF